ncbi:DsbC family protein [Nitrosomonas sp. Nm33]|uniref:DsbC family protein n=1 Tax=Nitrosomonas sp. Nm33 TaxID=133724 RepID=UPI00089CF559|nr:DsbC family protein [Nitrosomonas sp. Nm33]SDZ06534.1 thiol:disulfide interchange protein DsbC [Nitrosomonas sp. Nm33]
MRLHHFFMFLLLGFIFDHALADETQLKKTIQTHFPGTEIESLRKTPYMGLYEVVIGGEILYTDEKAEYFFVGHVVDAKTRVSLTSERMQQLRDARRIAIDTLPLELGIKAVKGDGKRTLVVYSDPHCPYCKRLEAELAKVNNITIYTLLYPILKNSMPTATAIWCSADRLKAWDDFMLRGIAPAGKDCETPLNTLLQSGQKNQVTGTPTLIFTDGSVVSGMIPAEEIEKRLNDTVKK